MMPPRLADLARRLETLASTAPSDPATETWAGAWVTEVTTQHLAAEDFWGHLGEHATPFLGLAEALLQPERFPDDRQAVALSFYLGATRAALAAVLAQVPGSHPRRVWLTQAETWLTEAEAAASRLRLVSAQAKQRQGAIKTNERYDPARQLAVEIASDRWEAWQAARIGHCPRISDVVKEARRILAADPRALGLASTPTWETIRQWLRSDCAIPPEARQSGQRKRLE